MTGNMLQKTAFSITLFCQVIDKMMKKCYTIMYNILERSENMGVKDSVKERTGGKVKEPKRYKVVMHNDDFTTMEFVVGVLIDIFRKDELSAQTLMMSVHKNGSAVVGVYPYDIAVTKVNNALSRAREQGSPFRMTVEEE